VVHNSGAGSLVLYVLGITGVDPIKYHLLFERFLDASRLDEIINTGGQVSGCFAKHTFVLMWNRTFKEIQDVLIGDVIMGIDNKPKHVINKWKHGKQIVYRIVYLVGENNYYFDVTKNHMLPIKRNEELLELPISKITIGDQLMETKNNYLPIVSIKEQDLIEVYDLCIDKLHYYRVCGKLLEN